MKRSWSCTNIPSTKNLPPNPAFFPHMNPNQSVIITLRNCEADREIKECYVEEYSHVKDNMEGDRYVSIITISQTLLRNESPRERCVLLSTICDHSVYYSKI